LVSHQFPSTDTATPEPYTLSLHDALPISDRGSLRLTKSKFLPRCQNPQFCGFAPRGKLVGECLPQTLLCGLRRLSPPRSCGEKGGHTMRKKYNTPHRSRVVKTRLSEDEYADFTARLAPYGISQSEFLRQAIRRATIRPVVHVSSVNDELLSAVGKLTAEYGRIGGNLNQIARYLNEYGVPYNTLSGEVRAAISDLAVLKYEVLKKVGD